MFLPDGSLDLCSRAASSSQTVQRLLGRVGRAGKVGRAGIAAPFAAMTGRGGLVTHKAATELVAEPDQRQHLQAASQLLRLPRAPFERRDTAAAAAAVVVAMPTAAHQVSLESRRL